jgi:hypothetical protein
MKRSDVDGFAIKDGANAQGDLDWKKDQQSARQAIEGWFPAEIFKIEKAEG